MKVQTVSDGMKHIHFIGIGGSGMTPLAEIVRQMGYTVTGSDQSESDNVLRLRRNGVQVFIPQCAENLGSAHLVVYTAAVRRDNPELAAAFERDMPIMERADLLGWITRCFPHTVSVSGTHGKTTTSSMISQIFLQANADPTVFIGGRLPLIEANGHSGKSDLMICEACEFQDHYLCLSTETAVILNVDADHLDYFKTLDGVIASFRTFAAKASGKVVYNADDDNTCQAVQHIPQEKKVSFGLDASADFSALHPQLKNGYGTYTLLHHGKPVIDIALGVPGEHNISNSLAAAAAAYINGATFEQIRDGLRDFGGAGRRFEKIGTWKGVTIVDDYAHHPTEIEATIRSAKGMGFSRVIAVFQPFTYSRTQLLLKEFADALSKADEVFVSEIMASREINEWGVRSEDITDQMSNAQTVPTFEEICELLLPQLKEGDLVLTMGGGNVYLCARMLAKRLQQA